MNVEWIDYEEGVLISGKYDNWERQGWITQADDNNVGNFKAIFRHSNNFKSNFAK